MAGEHKLNLRSANPKRCTLPGVAGVRKVWLRRRIKGKVPNWNCKIDCINQSEVLMLPPPPPHSIAFIYLPSSLCHFSAAGVRVNGISMRDYVYAAWAKQIAVPLQGKVAAFGGVRFIMPNAYVHYLFTKWWRDSGAASPTHLIPLSSIPFHLIPSQPTNPTQSKPSSAFFIYGSDSLSAKSSHIIRRAHAHANCPHPAGSCSSDCFRIIAHWFGQFVSRFQTIICWIKLHLLSESTLKNLCTAQRNKK